MKKLSILIALILCITTGGVYATWYYSGAENVADVSEPITINLEDAQTVGSHGSYTLVKEMNGAQTFFRIDQMDSQHTAGLVCAGTIKLVFTPNVHASSEIKNGDFDTWIYFTGNFTTLTYNGQSIFKSVAANSVETGIKIDNWTVTSEGKLEYDLTQLLKDTLQFENTFKLDTLVDYNNFASAIDGIKFNVHVTDGIVAENTNTPAVEG